MEEGIFCRILQAIFNTWSFTLKSKPWNSFEQMKGMFLHVVNNHPGFSDKNRL